MIRSSRALVVGAAALVLGACASGPTAPVGEELRAEVEFVGASVSGADVDPAAMSRLGSGILAQLPGENSVVSPLSLVLALAILREGATGVTARELDEVLGLDPAAPGESVAALRARLAPLDGDVSTVDRGSPPEEALLHVADALFAARDADVSEEFLERAARFHDAGVTLTDFAGGTAKEVLDAWVRRETGGLVEEAPGEPDPETRLVIMNAVVLAARWRLPFDPESTQDAPFTRADGSQVTVPTMTALGSWRYAEGPGWQAVELPYTSDLAMILALPGPLTAEQWDEVRAAFAAGPSESMVQLHLPRWEHESRTDLREVLPTLGIRGIFAPHGELDGVFPDAFVASALQAATITVAERGTVAAAVTQVDAMATGMPMVDVELRLDRPFDYQVVTEGDLVPVFVGHVADPS